MFWDWEFLWVIRVMFAATSIYYAFSDSHAEVRAIRRDALRDNRPQGEIALSSGSCKMDLDREAPVRTDEIESFNADMEAADRPWRLVEQHLAGWTLVDAAIDVEVLDLRDARSKAEAVRRAQEWLSEGLMPT
jgi:hypothetical protein